MSNEEKMQKFAAMCAKAMAEVMAEQQNRTPEQVVEDKQERDNEDWRRKQEDFLHGSEAALDYMPKAYVDKARHVIASDPRKGLGLTTARYYRAMGTAKLQGRSAMDVAKGWGDPWLAAMIEEGFSKSQTAGTGTQGGFLIPEVLSAEMILLLDNATIMRKAGADKVSMPMGHLNLPRETSGPTASYVGESANVNSSQGAYDQLNLSSKTLRTIVPISNNLLIVPDAKADQRVRDLAIRKQALREDLAFLRGDGTANTPKGVRYWTNTSNIFTTAGTAVANTNTDAHKAVRLLTTNNVALVNPTWIIPSRALSYLDSLRGTDVWVWKPSLDDGKFVRHPFLETNQVPTNLGGGTETEIYFVEMTQCVIADQMMMSVSVHPDAAYYDGSAVQSGLSRNETAIAITSMHDFGMYHDYGASIQQGCTYGA